MPQMGQQRRARLGFIGISGGNGGYHGGSWATNSHLKYLQSDRNKSYEITALQNSTRVSAEKAAAKYALGDVGCYGDPQQLADDPNVDIVAVSIKVPLHYEPTMAALKANKDVFVEWPLARNLADAEEMMALASEKGVRTMVGLQGRYNPSVIAAKKLVDDGELGEILATTVHGYGMIMGATMNEQFGYGLPIEAGVNLLTIPFGHSIDAFCWVLGEMKYVSATLANRRKEIDLTNDEGKVVSKASKTSHDFIAVTGELEKSGGAVSIIYEGGNNPSGLDFLWQIEGTKGTIVLEGKPGEPGLLQMFQPVLKFGKIGEQLKEMEVVQLKDFSDAVGQAWDAFSEGENGVVRFGEALVRHRMIDAIYRSNDSGSRQTYI